ncbi:MAG: EAL domain-containing protein [Lachnospiraceae bacterium]|nr:EAL domain-containing protein [Lachnospiraceae bacterium]
MANQSKHEKQKNLNNKRKLPIRVLTLTIMIAVAGLTGLIFLSYNMDRIARTYKNVVELDYINLEYMTSISQKFYQHQSFVFQYVSVLDDEARRSLLEDEADKIQEEIINEEKTFSDNVIGTVYESGYHSIYSGLNGYFKNVEYIFEFAGVGDFGTAEYYMNSILIYNIQEVKDSVDLLDVLITDDVNMIQQEMSNRMEISRTISIVIIIFLTVSTAIGLSWCVKISREIANIDPLTQVNNIEKFQSDMERLHKKGRLKEYICVCVNIKDFTLINQQMGSATGDMVLRNYAAMIEQFLQKDEKIARIGGDQFILLVRDERIEGFEDFIDKIPVTVEKDLRTTILQLESRCGLYDIKDGVTVGDIVDSAHLALSQTKQKSLDRVWFEESMLEQAYDRKTLLTEYKNGIKDKEFVVYYQPKVNILSNTLCGCEALVRWQKDSKIVPPYMFIPALEEEGRITELDFYVFEQMCKDIRAWLDSGITPVRVSSNFSKLHLRNTEFADNILEIVERYDIESKYIEIELTESSGYEDFDAFIKFVNRMKERGIFVSIDDFGTGFSSLSLLKQLDVDVIKIDKSFIDGVCVGDEANESLVKNIIYMIKDLNRHVICEGVETAEQADFLRKQNCHMVQGYLFDKPLPHDVFEKRLKKPKYEKG